MYTSEEQTKKLIDAGIKPDSADMMVVAGRGKNPFKDWNPIPRTPENCKKYEGKDMMPVWSDECLINMLPTCIVDRDTPSYDALSGSVVDTRYEIRIQFKIIPGRGRMYMVGYLDPSGNPPKSCYLSSSLTTALVDIVIKLLCTDEANIVNYEW